MGTQRVFASKAVITRFYDMPHSPLQADWCNHLLRRVDVTSGLVTTLAGSVVGSNNYGHADGVGTAASFYYPYGVAMDAAGNSVIVVSIHVNASER